MEGSISDYIYVMDYLESKLKMLISLKEVVTAASY